MKKTFCIIFSAMFLLGNTAYADNDWTWSCEVGVS